MFIFGAGNIYSRQTQDASGAAVANPTPVKFGTLQDISLDVSFDTKELHGQNQFPVAVGRGKAKVMGKAKFATMNGALLNSLLFGQTLAVGQIAIAQAVAGQVPAATTYTVTPTVPGSGTFSEDLGVFYASTGVQLTRVASTPAQGQYSVDESTGIYTFAAADASANLLFDFEYTISASGTEIVVGNKLMGYAPQFEAHLFAVYNGNQFVVKMPACISSKMSLATKLDDFAIPEFDFSAFADASGTVLTIGSTD